MVNLKVERERSGLTQVELANKAGVARTTISMIEQGINQPSIKLAKRLARILKIKWQSFF